VTGKISPWAILSAVLAVGLCPLVTVAAIPAGLWALRDCRRGRRGRRLAIAAIGVSVIFTPLTSLAAWWWNDHVRIPLLEGPAEIFAEGQRGHASAFAQAAGRPANDASAGVFLKRLTEAVGVMKSSRLAEPGSDDHAPEIPEDLVGWAMWVPYDAMFDQGAAMVWARFRLTDASGWTTRFDAFRVDLEEGAPLIWPPAAGGEQ